MTRVHGGPDALGVARWDFSTNANACGAEPTALGAVHAADRTRYPDPACTALREALAALHGVPAQCIVIAASASEFIVRCTAGLAQRRPGARVHAPQPGYADYAEATRGFGLQLAAQAIDADLVWHTEPGSPFGDVRAAPALRPDARLVIDRAYAPLRLGSTPEPATPATAWQLWSPNKALGLTGVRGAYAVAPAGAEAECEVLAALAPSWPIGADGVAMLLAWTTAPTQRWVRESLATLATWKEAQLARCRALGWRCEPSNTPFYVADWRAFEAAGHSTAERLAALRRHGIKLRDLASLGLPGRVRLSVQPPEAQQALAEAWQAVLAGEGGCMSSEGFPSANSRSAGPRAARRVHQ